MTRYWTCVKCSTRSPRRKQICPSCGTRRKATRKPAHMKALVEPYEVWVAKYGAACNICGREQDPEKKRHHRDHCHKTGEPRGILCFRCNAALRNYMTVEWLRSAAAYLEREDAA